MTLYHTVTACKTEAETVMRSTKNGTWNKGGCNAVMVLDAVRLTKNLTLRNVKENATRGAQPWDVLCRMSALSLQLCLVGMPESLALRNDLDFLIAKCLVDGACERFSFVPFPKSASHALASSIYATRAARNSRIFHLCFLGIS